MSKIFKIVYTDGQGDEHHTYVPAVDEDDAFQKLGEVNDNGCGFAIEEVRI